MDYNLDASSSSHAPSYPSTDPLSSTTMTPTVAAPAETEPKTVRFQLITPDSPHTTARLPMRVQIYPHDATDSIVTTVKNFYGLYSSPTSSKGVSFEDEVGTTLIARYENFRNDMVVYVRVIEEPALSPSAFAARGYQSPPAAANGDSDVHHGYPAQTAVLPSFHHLQQQIHGEHIARPGSRTSRKRSPSPASARGRRSDSASTHSKNRSRSSKNRGVGHSQSEAYGPDNMNGYSSGDGAPGSNTSRLKEQQSIGNTEISVENIVEGGRRKRAKFESSELPLFAPPQMPAATSNPSVSPARRADNRPPLPFIFPGQSPFNGAAALHSPQNYTSFYNQPGVYTTPGADGRRTRASIGSYPSAGGSSGMGILPTPDPTVSSVSEEDKDVAMQLMRLGEVSVSYGRTSTSTLDDTFSGWADAASSTGATSDSESESENGDDDQPHRKQRLDLNGVSRKIYQSVEPADEDVRGAEAEYRDNALFSTPNLMAAPKAKKPIKAATGAKAAAKAKAPKAAAKAKSAPKTKKQQQSAAVVSGPGGVFLLSPASQTPSRKISVSSSGATLPAGAAAAAAAALSGMGDEGIADLSSQPRCQRCRKSKKGCDRQRPCGRCRDAGIPAELCISEDEGNGRKGRYGRHMGVPIKKEAAATSTSMAANTAASSMQPPPPPSQMLQQLPLPSVPSQQPQAPQPLQPQQQATLPPIQPQTYHAPSPPSPPSQPMHQPQPQSQPQPQLHDAKAMPSLLPPAHISSSPIVAPTVPDMMMAGVDKNKKRKR